MLDGATFQDPDSEKVPGLPILGSASEEEAPDLSHIELRNSMMSHQNWRNYGVYMEAELALLQDIGFDIDRKDFYGHSEYNDDKTYLNQEGTPPVTPRASPISLGYIAKRPLESVCIFMGVRIQ